MRLHGYCTGCRRFRLVRVTSAGMARVAMKRVPEGVCSECEQLEETERKARRR